MTPPLRVPEGRGSILGVLSRAVVYLFSARGLPLSIVLVALAVFSPALWNGFVDWDDEVNLVANPHYRGLGWEQLRWMFTTVLMGHWIPLTWMTLGLDYLVWGMNPVGYHLTNLLLHAANAGVFYVLALRLLRLAMPGFGEATLRLGAGASALFFAVHPLRVESVAWVTERRDVLSGLFFLLTILMYLKACEVGGQHPRRWLAGSVGCFALALASKSIVMTLPVVLIVLDHYPLGRLGSPGRQWATPQARKVWIEKVPYFLLAVAGGGLALYAVSTNSFLTPLARYPLFPDRVWMALYSLWFYLWKTLLPLGLLPLYELPVRVDPLDPPFVVSAIAVGVITGGLLLMRRRWPAGLAVWAYYGAMLAPVSGLVHAGHQLTHDRYSYLSCLGWAAVVGAGVCAGIRASPTGTLRPVFARLAAGAAPVWFLGLAVLTWQQVQVWRDTETLWRYAIEVEPECSTCQSNLGTFLVNHGYTMPALGHLEQAVVLRQDLIPHASLGLALLNAGRLPEAVEQLRLALERTPAAVGARNNLAVALLRQGTPEEAMAHLAHVIRLDPEHVEGHTNLGAALTDLGRPAEALRHFRRAIELNPELATPHFGLARAYVALGRTGAARAEYEIVKRLDPHGASVLSPLLNTSGSDSGAAPGHGLPSEQGQGPRSSGGRGPRE